MKDGLVLDKFSGALYINDVAYKFKAIKYTTKNLKEILNFTGQYQNFDKHFDNFDAYESHVKNNDYAFFIYNSDNSTKSIAFPGNYIVKYETGDVKVYTGEEFNTFTLYFHIE